VVGGEQHAVGQPVAATERAVHTWEQEATEQRLAKHGVEQHHHHDHREPGPVAAEEPLAGLALEEGAQAAAGRLADAERQQPGGGIRDDQWDQQQPQQPADPAGTGAARGPQPQGVADHRPAQRPLLASDEDDHQ
jgi:hypothetical protein